MDSSLEMQIHCMLQNNEYVRSQSVIYPILMHSISNVLMVGIGYAFAML